MDLLTDDVLERVLYWVTCRKGGRSIRWVRNKRVRVRALRMLDGCLFNYHREPTKDDLHIHPVVYAFHDGCVSGRPTVVRWALDHLTRSHTEFILGYKRRREAAVFANTCHGGSVEVFRMVQNKFNLRVPLIGWKQAMMRPAVEGNTPMFQCLANEYCEAVSRDPGYANQTSDVKDIFLHALSSSVDNTTILAILLAWLQDLRDCPKFGECVNVVRAPLQMDYLLDVAFPKYDRICYLKNIVNGWGQIRETLWRHAMSRGLPKARITGIYQLLKIACRDHSADIVRDLVEQYALHKYQGARKIAINVVERTMNSARKKCLGDGEKKTMFDTCRMLVQGFGLQAAEFDRDQGSKFPMLLRDFRTLDIPGIVIAELQPIRKSEG